MINEVSDNQITPKGKVYKDRMLWIGTFLGGPLVAGYIIAENFKAFGRPDSANKTWLFTILATIIIFAGVFSIPEDSKIPDQLIPLIYIGIAALIFRYYQGKQIQSHIESGGQVYQWGRGIIIGIIGLAVTLITVAGAIFINVVTDATNHTKISTNTYGFSHEISYYDNNISTEEVDTLALAFTITTFFHMTNSRFVFVEKVDNNYEISIPCRPPIAYDTNEIEPFIKLRACYKITFTFIRLNNSTLHGKYPV